MKLLKLASQAVGIISSLRLSRGPAFGMHISSTVVIIDFQFFSVYPLCKFTFQLQHLMATMQF